MEHISDYSFLAAASRALKISASSCSIISRLALSINFLKKAQRAFLTVHLPLEEITIGCFTPQHISDYLLKITALTSISLS